jgi:hypothetical protein
MVAIQPDTDAGLYQLASIPDVLNAYGLDLFLRAYLEKFPPADLKWRERLRVGLKSRLAAAFEDEATDLHSRVMKTGFNGEALSLTALTKEICKETDPNFARARVRVRDRFLNPFHELLLWEVIEDRRTYRSGAGEAPSYRIRIGEAALHYHHLVFKPIYLKRLREYLMNVDSLTSLPAPGVMHVMVR